MNNIVRGKWMSWVYKNNVNTFSWKERQRNDPKRRESERLEEKARARPTFGHWVWLNEETFQHLQLRLWFIGQIKCFYLLFQTLFHNVTKAQRVQTYTNYTHARCTGFKRFRYPIKCVWRYIFFCASLHVCCLFDPIWHSDR